MWRREYLVAKIGKCGVVDRSLKLSLSRQVAFIVFIFILRIHISCLALPPTQILIHNYVYPPGARSPQGQSDGRHRACKCRDGRFSPSGRGGAMSSRGGRTKAGGGGSRAEASGRESRAEASGGGGEEETRTRGVQTEGGGGDSEAGGRSKGREGIEGDQSHYARGRTSSNVREEAQGNGGEREDEAGEGGVGRRRYDSRRDSGGG